ncbi:protoporphyrinogen oxidase HemJ [Amylibacter sp. IMCC11727]|uniref:protoporphyrinogen oxidase HemJ n=1 Tax=Amylibacter sp. IMCC11727 TaxID=3039851 RepID=UPI00244DF15B|nr:protoporphyrinogen oxidase HemJ [Amylibacter sp. IMCC11727]WGI22053.1 protoporphyrinogen oxidase HemJ [Amylibacter sp. IMCC11727]
MTDLLATFYPWIKTLHIISVISWMAGLLYLPRLFVNHVEHGPVGSETSEVFKGMEERLMRIIMAPAMMATWLFGLMLAFTPGIVDWSSFYPWIKAAMILGMTGFHHWLIKVRKEFAADKNERPAKTYRIANELPTVMMIVIVIMIVVRPF